MADRGVYPLVCVVCGKSVGVINISAFLEAEKNGEDYICKACREKISPRVENELLTMPQGTWGYMTRNELRH